MRLKRMLAKRKKLLNGLFVKKRSGSNFHVLTPWLWQSSQWKQSLASVAQHAGCKLTFFKVYPSCPRTSSWPAASVGSALKRPVSHPFPTKALFRATHILKTEMDCLLSDSTLLGHISYYFLGLSKGFCLEVLFCIFILYVVCMHIHISIWSYIIYVYLIDVYI